MELMVLRPVAAVCKPCDSGSCAPSWPCEWGGYAACDSRRSPSPSPESIPSPATQGPQLCCLHFPPLPSAPFAHLLCQWGDYFAKAVIAPGKFFFSLRVGLD